MKHDKHILFLQVSFAPKEANEKFKRLQIVKFGSVFTLQGEPYVLGRTETHILEGV